MLLVRVLRPTNVKSSLRLVLSCFLAECWTAVLLLLRMLQCTPHRSGILSKTKARVPFCSQRWPSRQRLR